MGSSKYKIEKKCEQCGNPFFAKTVYSKYCSEKCMQAAYRQKKQEQKKEEQRKAQAEKVPADRPYISISEAVALFGVSRDTIYRLIRNGRLPAVNLGERLTRISRTHIESMFEKVVPTSAQSTPQPQQALYSFAAKDCYTIGEITEKYGISPSTVYANIRKAGIPTCQKGRFVYVPKAEIDRLYKSKK